MPKILIVAFAVVSVLAVSGHSQPNPGEAFFIFRATVVPNKYLTIGWERDDGGFFKVLSQMGAVEIYDPGAGAYPDIVLRGGWVYLIGDKPRILIGNHTIVAQAEGSSMIAQFKQDGWIRLLLLETQSAQPAGQASLSLNGAVTTFSKGEYLNVTPFATPLQPKPFNVDDPNSPANDPAEVTALRDAVNAVRRQRHVP